MFPNAPAKDNFGSLVVSMMSFPLKCISTVAVCVTLPSHLSLHLAISSTGTMWCEPTLFTSEGRSRKPPVA